MVILGAGGGVGLLAAQIGQVHQFNVIGVASASKRQLIEATGATFVESGDGAADRVRELVPGRCRCCSLIWSAGTAARDRHGRQSTRAAPSQPLIRRPLKHLGGGRVVQRTKEGSKKKITEVAEYGLVTPNIVERFALPNAQQAIATVEVRTRSRRGRSSNCEFTRLLTETREQHRDRPVRKCESQLPQRAKTGIIPGNRAGATMSNSSSVQTDSAKPRKRRPFQRFLTGIETVGNKLPHPATLFGILAVLVLLFSWLLSTLEVTAEDPVEGGQIEIFNLLSAEGIQWLFTSAVDNFLGFAPLGVVLVTMLGIGMAEQTGSRCV